jgi:hypothetical protein
VYKGLDIVSNKVTDEEMENVTHHMIDIADPFQLITVTDYQRKTLEIVSRLDEDFFFFFPLTANVSKLTHSSQTTANRSMTFMKEAKFQF